MSITRRKFLKAGTLVALSAAIPLKAMGQQIPKGNDGNPIDQSKDIAADPLSHYNRSAFSSYLNSIFRLYTGYSTIDVALVEVKDLMPWAAKAQNGAECFSLLFRGGNVALPQNTYRIEHPSLGTFQLFLVPGGPDDNGAQSFVAIINRLPYSQALLPAPTRLSKPSGRVTPQQPVTPAAPPKTSTPAPTTTPLKKTKPSKRRGGDEDFFEGVID
ncbi:MAG TPA: twin-arginine translocation signal domain-containing protein [Pyrinomonadaceae bacterium]|nr:twin-arginine translocation signal domain-containing protein [Pyrinomonadaceae bacterium]